MRRYETTFILSPDLEEADLEKNIVRYTNIITAGGGTIEKEDRWGMRRLAYQIQKKTQGYYVQLVHESGPDIPRELERQFLLNENCLRYLTVRAQKPAPEPEAKVETETATAAATEGANKPAADLEENKPAKPEDVPSPAVENPPAAGDDAGETETKNS